MNLYSLSFILNGVVKMILCCLGVVGNAISILLLLSVRMRNSFNKLLAILAVFDLVYLVTMMMDSLRDLGLHSYIQTLMFPHFIFPLNSISLMCSIYMTLIVALERYMAVYNPLDYNRRQQDSTAQRYHIINFVCPLIILAFRREEVDQPAKPRHSIITTKDRQSIRMLTGSVSRIDNCQ